MVGKVGKASENVW